MCFLFVIIEQQIMADFKVVSIDMFGTLVDVDGIACDVWKTFLKDEYTVELAVKYWKRASELVFKYFDEEVIRKHQYVSPMVIFEKCYSELFQEMDLDFSPEEAAKVLAYYHSSSKPFSDTLPFLNSAGKKYPICLSSDTNDVMLGELTKLYAFDYIFTSDHLEAYKSNAGKRFFSAVVTHYGVKPQEIIHIGDSNSDIIGASEAGLITCWLNRNGRQWSHNITPDYEVNSLFETASVLGIEVESEQ